MPDDDSYAADLASAERKIKNLNLTRRGKKQSITRTLASIQNLDVLSEDDLRFNINKLNSLKSILASLDTEVNDLMLANNKLTEAQYLDQMASNEEVYDKVDKAILSLTRKLDSSRNAVQLPATNNEVSFSKHKVSLPNLQLPTFDGSPEKYHRFITSFDSLISKYNMGTFEKYSYLYSNLSGTARKLLDSIALTELNYESAVKLLNEAYSDKLEQQYCVIRKLVALKLSESETDAYRWISDARVLCDQIKSLSITGEIFAQYFLWQGMNNDFRKQFVAITNTSKPDYDQIMNNLFDANLRFIDSIKAKNDSAHLIAAAVAVDSPLSAAKTNIRNTGCSLCSSDGAGNYGDHKLHQCKVYNDPYSKVNKLRSINGCIRCGSVNHGTKLCNSKWVKQCSNCKNIHLNYLCTSGKKLISTKNSTGKKEGNNASESTPAQVVKVTQNHMATLPNYSSFNDVVLPTATVHVDVDGSKVPWRVFKDMGSQSTFVRGTPDEIPDCKILKNISLKVRGINSEEVRDTVLVSFPVHVPNQGKFDIQAICTDKINTYISVPGLNDLATNLRSKRYNLADTEINCDSINNIRILMGSDNSHIFPVEQQNFGHNNRSSLLHTPSGVMLAGSIADYTADIPVLPEKQILTNSHGWGYRRVCV